MEEIFIQCIDNPPVSKTNATSNQYELYYCQRGKIKHSINSDSITLYHGDVIIIPPNTTHTLSIESPYTVYYAIYFNSSAISETFIGELRKGKHIYPKIHLPIDEVVFFERCIFKLQTEFDEKKKNYNNVLKNILSVLVNILDRTCQSFDTITAPENKNTYIKYCISYTDVHCCEDISLNEIAKLSTMSKVLFCKLFKKETGLSFKDYLNRKRIQKAIALIKTEEKLTEIAYMCGYTEQSTFYRNFIKFTGVSPSDFKKRYKNTAAINF